MNRHARLDYLVTLFESSLEGYTSHELAELTDVTPRQIQLDLRALETDPYFLPLKSEGYRWALVDWYTASIPALTINADEATAMFLAARLLARYSDELNPHIISTLKKLAAILPPHLKSQVWASADFLSYRESRPHVTDALRAVTRAWFGRRKVRVVYYGQEGKVPKETVLSPYLLEPSIWGLATYVLGYSEQHQAERTFKVERFMETEVLEERFQIPPTFNPTKRWESAWNVMYGDTLQTVVLRFAPSITWRVKESIWHPSQQLEELADGGCRATFRVHLPKEMKPWIRQWGADVVVEAPASFRAEIAAEMKQAGANYDQV